MAVTPTASLEGQVALVAGGAGFVGSQVVRELAGLGAQVVVLDSLLNGARAHVEGLGDGVRFVLGDALDAWRLSKVFRDVRPAYVFNLIGDTFVPSSYDAPKRFFQINVECNLNLLMACHQFGVKRMLYVSSTEVYGEARVTPMDETHPLDPVNTYAVSKLAADRLCSTFHKEHGVPVVIARIFNAYGPRATAPYVIPEIIRQLTKGPTVTLGNVDAKRDFTFVADTARALASTIVSAIPDGDVVNVGSNHAWSVRELVALIGRLMGMPQVDIQTDARRLRRNDIAMFQCDASKLHAATGWSPSVGIEEGLSRTIDWYRAHGNRWLWEERAVAGPLGD